MRDNILDRLIQRQVEIANQEIDQIDYIIMDIVTYKALKAEYIYLYETDEPTHTEIEEIAGARIVLPLSGNVSGGFQFASLLDGK
jgi:hypothetical protein